MNILMNCGHDRPAFYRDDYYRINRQVCILIPSLPGASHLMPSRARRRARHKSRGRADEFAPHGKVTGAFEWMARFDSVDWIFGLLSSYR